jgi:1,2-diacylglycerol 3-beta-galactosyltransferase
MILNPGFYAPQNLDRGAERIQLGLRPDLPTGLVLFGGQGSMDMVKIARTLNNLAPGVQLILLCGRNALVAERLRALPRRIPMFVEGFTSDIPRYMALADFFIGKAGPGSVSEALAMRLPVIVERNAWTLPQERYNADWIQQRQVGMVLKSFSDIAEAVGELLNLDTLCRYRNNAAAIRNFAVFEIPELLDKILSDSLDHGALGSYPAFPEHSSLDLFH